MDWISTRTSCFAVSNAIAKTVLDLSHFVRDVRESRAELASLSAELHALDDVLDLLKDDAASVAFPADLALQTPAVVASSGALVAEIGVILGGGEGNSGSEKRNRWLAMRQHVAESRCVLGVHRLTLGLALDLVAFSSTHLQPDDDGPPIANATADDFERILDEIRQLRTRVCSDLADEDVVLLLQIYLDALQQHAQAAAAGAEAGPRRELAPSRGPGSDSKSEDGTTAEASDDDTTPTEHDEAPDAAGEVLDDADGQTPAPASAQESQDQPHSNIVQQPPPFTFPSPAYSMPRNRFPSPPPPPPPLPRGRRTGSALLPSCEINDLMDELREELMIRPPTPPPTATARADSALGIDGSPENETLPTAAHAAHNTTAPLQPLPLIAEPVGELNCNGYNSSNTCRQLDDAKTPPQTNNKNPARFSRFLRQVLSASATRPHEPDRHRTKATDAVSGSALASHSSDSNERSNHARDNCNGSNVSSGGNGNTRSLAVADYRDRNRFSASDSSSASMAVTSTRPAGCILTSKKIGNTSLRKKKKDGAKTDNEPDAVFGVSLRKSIQVAASSARTHHTGSRGASRREFPLCILKCYNFIRFDNGLLTPGIFAGGVPGFLNGDADPAASLDVVNPDRVRAMYEHFSTPPLYGADLDNDSLSSVIAIESGSGAVLSSRGYSRHDAAALILHFLEALPKPLVPESAARRWITLSRQASLPGSYAKRLDQCIDFWEEALEGVRGPARSLLKLLLNLWGEIADAAEHNDMTAERLAGRVLRPLTHLEGGQYETDYMLSLAFIIRKRSEYALLLRGGDRKSNAAFEA
ncbi:hypothetical protein SEPCBS119000_004483 [Sporothrix epigloea]|uniref:Rho-GAP domain-containing protein n=1 Tax=Sporothrix epigloea TaxID=1892477 RepID=A0ABP0DSE2_9PEZI